MSKSNLEVPVKPFGNYEMSHAEVVSRSAEWLHNNRKCWVVVTERGNGTEIVDAIGWRYIECPDGFLRLGSIQIECKASYSDFKADQKKDHRNNPEYIGIGNLRYYMSPKAIVPMREVPKGWGLLWISKSRVYEKIKPVWMENDYEDDLRILLNAVQGDFQSRIFELDKQIRGLEYDLRSAKEEGNQQIIESQKCTIDELSRDLRIASEEYREKTGASLYSYIYNFKKKNVLI